MMTKKYVSSETRQLVNRNDILQEACSLQSQVRSSLRRGNEGNKLLRIVDYFIKFETDSLNMYLGLVNST